MTSRLLTTAAAVAVAAAGFAGTAVAQQQQIQIVGSSTVFPFATAVAERFAQKAGFPAPVVEFDGTGGGIKLSAAALAKTRRHHRRIARHQGSPRSSSAPTTASTDITEVLIGYDGLSIAVAKAAPLTGA